MSTEDPEFEHQTTIFKALASEVRLRLLHQATEQKAISAPDLSKSGKFEITSESIYNNLKILKEAGFLESSEVRGPGNRPRTEFKLADSGKTLRLEVLPDDYDFELKQSDVYSK